MCIYKNIKVTEWGNKSRFCSTLQSLTWRERKKKKIKTQRNIHRINFTLFNFFSFFFSYFFSCMLKKSLWSVRFYICCAPAEAAISETNMCWCRFCVNTCRVHARCFTSCLHVLQNVSAKCYTYTQPTVHTVLNVKHRKLFSRLVASNLLSVTLIVWLRVSLDEFDYERNERRHRN